MTVQALYPLLHACDDPFNQFYNLRHKEAKKRSSTQLQHYALSSLKKGLATCGWSDHVEARLTAIEATLSELSELIRRQVLLGALERGSEEQENHDSDSDDELCEVNFFL